MLSRVADGLYWMSRYLERAEHTARLIDVHMNLMLDQSASAADARWLRVASLLGVRLPPGAPRDAKGLLNLLAFEASQPCSIVSCIMSARENARQVREQTSSEMWEELNRLFHEVRQSGGGEPQQADPLEFAAVVRTGTHLFEGVTDSTMSHGEGWQFIQLGRFLERATNTAMLLDVHFREFYGEKGSDFEDGAHLEWLGLLKSCSAFEPYCKVYTAELRPQRIAEFLMLNEEFPHSLRFAADRIELALDAIEMRSAGRNVRLRKLAGRMGAALSYGQIEEILGGEGLHVYLEMSKRQCHQIHDAMYEAYIHYPVQAALGN